MGVMNILRSARRALRPDTTAAATFLGPSARTFDWDRLITAWRGELAGEDRYKLWRDTMTTRAGNGAWHQEISDHGAESTFDAALRGTDPRTPHWARIRDILHHPGLEVAYGDRLMALPVKIMEQRPNDHLPDAAMILRGRDLTPVEMRFGRGFANDRPHEIFSGKRIALHETQHGVQALDGTPIGDTPQRLFDEATQAQAQRRYLEAIDQARTYLARGMAENPAEALTMAQAPPARIPVLVNNWDSVMRGFDRDLARARANPYANVGDPAKFANEGYVRSEGERDARLTQESVDLTDAERAVFPPWVRMRYLGFGPVQDERSLIVHSPPGHVDKNQRAIVGRILQDDAIGRALADLVRASAAGGGAASALAIADRARQAQDRRREFAA